MRVNLKVLILVIGLCLTFLSLSVWTRCGGELTLHRIIKDDSSVGLKLQSSDPGRDSLESNGLEEIDCHINGEYSIPCRREADEVYIPFSFVHKYFEIYGKLASYDGYERFEWSHSYSKVYYPKGKYDPRGVFLYFENYNVELRDRVKYISATEGVPVSTQWSSHGYYYPTQVAQFGLAHYSKNLTEPEPRVKVLEDGSSNLGLWEGKLSRDEGVLLFNTSDTLPVTLKVDIVLDFVLSVDLQLKSADNSSLIVYIHNREKNEVWRFHYSCQSPIFTSKDEDIYHQISCKDGVWTHLTRDLLVDLQKGLSFQSKSKKKPSRTKFKVGSIQLIGSGKLDNLTLSTSCHLEHFYAAAKWLVNHQDQSTGGWANPVRRKGTHGIKDLKPGWLSAMGQGHGMSLLARAYYHSGDETFLKSALKGMSPFHTPSKQGGVLAHFLDVVPWYEEYPTSPSSFVLNGFIYSLIGLYDLLTLAPSSQKNDAMVLFQQGMSSLKKLLLLFDNGSGSLYDLRHVGLDTAPNIARWDYHSTHVNQLLLLATIDNDTLLSNTAHRWMRYMVGKRAPHN